MEWIFSEDGEFVERECLLFEAGEYPDKGVTITADDLREIVRNSEETVPMRIEHLEESPFDEVLGVVTRLRVKGGQLWGTLRQPVEAWRLAQRAGARALSVGLDMARKRLVETSFVRRPRVASAQVFGMEESSLSRERQKDYGVMEHFTVTGVYPDWEGRREIMASVRQMTEGLIGYLRGFANEEAANFAVEREALVRERDQLRGERVEQQILEWKRQGRLRATETAERLARTLLLNGDSNLVAFDGESVPLSVLFSQFVAANGVVVPMGEHLPGERSHREGHSGARERLVSLAMEKARQEGLSFTQSFAAVTAAHPELSSAAREE